eukprot:UN24554
MQIDTHNREWSPSAYNVSGHKNWFLPKMEDGKNDLASGLNPLIECPCGTRITKSIVKKPSQILTKGNCAALIKTADDCKTAATAVTPILGSQTVNNSTMPNGCLLQPTTNGYNAVFNAAASTVPCGTQGFVPISGHVKAIITVAISIPNEQSVTITLSGPDKVWFGIGFGADKMADLPYAIIVDGNNGTVTERKLGSHAPGDQLATTVKVMSNKVAAGVRTVVLARSTKGNSADYYTFSTLAGSIPIITAVGNKPDLSYHAQRTAATIFLLPSANNACVCAPTSTPFLTYMSKYSSPYGTDCEPFPRGDMLKNHNPACQMETYKGGLQCCHHGWFLTDLEQDHLIPPDVDTYYLKFRFYYQEYVEKTATAPASHTLLHHWVFLIDANVNDYEESQCVEGTMCESQITARVNVPSMGFQYDNPPTFSSITLHYMAAHCHAPSCIREELYNSDTGDLICRVEAKYGQGD